MFGSVTDLDKKVYYWLTYSVALFFSLFFVYSECVEERYWLVSTSVSREWCDSKDVDERIVENTYYIICVVALYVSLCCF